MIAALLEELGFVTSTNGVRAGADFESPDKHTIIEVKTTAPGGRDLNAAVIELAVRANSGSVTRAILLILSTKMSNDGLRRAWEASLSVLRPEIAERMHVITGGEGPQLVSPSTDPSLVELARRVADHHPERQLAPRPNRSFEVMKILLHRWLLGRGPIAIKELQAQAGLSYPTVSLRLDELGDVVGRQSNRSVLLREFPRKAWSELLITADRVRPSLQYADNSGRPPDYDYLLGRLERTQPENVGVAGVAGARHWQTNFDLDGLPRLDLVVHAPDGIADLKFVTRLDPTLSLTTKAHSAAVVVHVLPRAASLFDVESGASTVWADPVEILLDLHELRLIEQADAFIRHLRASQ